MLKYEIVAIKNESNITLLSVDEISRLVGLHPEMVYRLFVRGLIDPHIDRPEPLFEVHVVDRIRKIQRLKNDLGINLEGCAVILDLLDRITEIENRLQYYERSILW